MISEVGHRMVVLTPPGAGAIGVVRVVGTDAVGMVNQAFRPASGGGLSVTQIDRLRYGRFVDGEEAIDDVIVCVTTLGSHGATEPRSHEEKNVETPKRRNAETGGEDERHGGTKARRHEGGETLRFAQGDSHSQRHEQWVVDISAHGGVRVMERILQTLERLGASVCEAGEAVGLTWPTGSLIEHEAVEVLTRAKTERAVRFLAWQRANLLAALEDVALLCRSDPEKARKQLTAIADGFPVARSLVEGATVALVGPPNSGKSTLFNRLIGRPATVVSPHPGTTRDWVAEPLEMEGVPVTLVDTAGQREVDDPLEQQAVEAGRGVVERAEVRLMVLDGSQPLPKASVELLNASRSWSNCLMVMNKVDAGSVWGHEVEGPRGLKSEGRPGTGDHGQAALDRATRLLKSSGILSVSGLTGAGCDELLSAILEMLGYRGWVERVSCLFTARQVKAAADVLSMLPHDPVAAGQRLERCLIGRYEQVTTADGGL